MALAVCLLLDSRTELAIQRMWGRLEEAGVPTLLTHTHGRHVPHLSYVALRSWDLEQVSCAIAAMPDGGPVELRFDAVGLFRRGRTWLAPAATGDLVRRQQRLVDAVQATGADLHRNYLPGSWIPHVTLAPRVRLAQLPQVVAAAYDVLPLAGAAERAALVDSGTGERWPLPVLP